MCSFSGKNGSVKPTLMHSYNPRQSRAAAASALIRTCRSSKRQPHTYRHRKHSSEYEAAPGWQSDARTVLWQYGRFDEDAAPWRRLERVEDKRLPVERIDDVMFRLVWGRWVANSIDRKKIDFASSRRGSLRQHLGFGSQGYNSGNPNARASYGNKEWIYRIPSSPARRIGDRCNRCNDKS